MDGRIRFTNYDLDNGANPCDVLKLFAFTKLWYVPLRAAVLGSGMLCIVMCFVRLMVGHSGGVGSKVRPVKCR